MKPGFEHNAVAALLYLLGFLVAFSVIRVSPSSTEDIVIGALVIFAASWFEFKSRVGRR